MQSGSSELVRSVAFEKYMRPRLNAGSRRFSVAVKDVMDDLVSQGFPPANIPQICTALRKKSFLRQHQLEIESIEGPPKKMSTTVVYHYRVANPAPPNPPLPSAAVEAPVNENPEEWAARITGKFRGLLKEELAAYGGGEAFMRWIRSEDGDEA